MVIRVKKKIQTPAQQLFLTVSGACCFLFGCYSALRGFRQLCLELAGLGVCLAVSLLPLHCLSPLGAVCSLISCSSHSSGCQGGGQGRGCLGGMWLCCCGSGKRISWDTAGAEGGTTSTGDLGDASVGVGAPSSSRGCFTEASWVRRT